jgi:hypothetical protein
MRSKRTVDEMILTLPKAEQVMVKRLRALVQECLPFAIEKGYYGEGIPFYSRNRMICFIWPAAVVWGSRKTATTQKFKGVSFGFCQGNLMSNEDGKLLSEGRKQVYIVYFKSLNEINDDEVRALLFEASLIDETFAKKKKDKKKL